MPCITAVRRADPLEGSSRTLSLACFRSLLIPNTLSICSRHGFQIWVLRVETSKTHIGGCGIAIVGAPLKLRQPKQFLLQFGANAPRADKDKFKKHMNDMLDVGCLMLATMTPELQKQYEDMVAYEMIQNLKEIYEGQARKERYETSKALFQCKMSEGSPVGAHVIKMMGYIQTLEKLGFALNDELAIDVFLQSLSDSFNQFSILMVREEKGKGKKVAKSKGIGKTKPKGKEALKPKGGISKDRKCFHCGKPGHWKRNCLVYLEDVKKANAIGASVSEIKGYYFFNPKENKVFVARTRVLLEKEFFSNNGNGRNIEHKEVQQQQLNEPEVEQTSQAVEENSIDLERKPLRRSTRERHEPERYGSLITTHGDVILVDQDEPKT
ncbi:hypothetical protein GQ457_12G015890 [Hibiscus cannabinus]